LTGDVSEILRNWNSERSADSEETLFNLVYDELRRQAHRYLRRERAGHSLQTTALVNEAYLTLVKQESIEWESRRHFFGIAAMLMRRILIDYAKQKQRVRRGGASDDLPLENGLTVSVSDTNFDLLELDEVLTRLAGKDQHLAKVVELRFFSGLDVPATAKVLGLSESTIKRDWAMAKAWLYRELTR
jgi:RNA polymerase sigma factor (TIGR02999 family)